MAFGNKDKNDKDKGKTEKPAKAGTPKDLPVLHPTSHRPKPGRGQGQGRG